jgi:hypothetical protein
MSRAVVCLMNWASGHVGKCSESFSYVNKFCYARWWDDCERGGAKFVCYMEIIKHRNMVGGIVCEW